MIDVVIDENNIIRHVEFYGGCQGNTCGISKLVEGMEAREVVNRLRGITCIIIKRINNRTINTNSCVHSVEKFLF